jgi:hypothetical protein
LVDVICKTSKDDIVYNVYEWDGDQQNKPNIVDTYPFDVFLIKQYSIIRKATPEEIEEYEVFVNAKKYNL